MKRNTNLSNSTISCTKTSTRSFAGEEKRVGAHSKPVNLITNSLWWNRCPRKCLVTNAGTIGEPTPYLHVNRRTSKGDGIGTCASHRACVGLKEGGGIACTKPSCLTVLSGKYTPPRYQNKWYPRWTWCVGAHLVMPQKKYCMESIPPSYKKN